MAEAKTIFTPRLPELHLDELPAETRLALQELERETSGLDREFEIIGNLVTAADSQLRKVAPKIAIWLDDEIEPTNKTPLLSNRALQLGHRAFQLGWARISDTEWGLASRVIEVTGKESKVIGWHNISDPEAGIPASAPLRVALSKAPLSVRLAALEKLPKLIQALTKLARRRKEALETSRRALEQKQ
jgi:hypothetical protein